MRPILLSLISLLLLTGSALADGRAFEVSDYYDTTFVGAPVVHPDGKTVAFRVSHFDLKSVERWSDIWLMNADGSDQQQMTRGQHGDSSPIFSPDGKRLIFVSNRSDGSQLWALPLAGGEATQLTDFPGGVWDPVFSADGRYLAVTAEVDPACGDDADCNEKSAQKREDAKLSVHVADNLLYRHWTSWSDGIRPHVLLLDAATGEVLRDLSPGDFDTPTFSLGGGRGYDFSPDGRGIVLVSNHDADQASSTNADLWWVDLENEKAEAKNLTASNPGWDGSPLFATDGTLAYLSQTTPNYESDYFRLMLWDGSASRELVGRKSFDNWISDMSWSEDSQSLLFEADVKGRTPLFRVAVKDGAIQDFLTHGYIGGWGGTADGALLYTRRTVGEPPEIFRSWGTEDPKRLTFFNEELEKEVDIRPAEEMWVQGSGEYKVHVFLVKPHDFDPKKKYPLILNVHGGPQSQWSDSYRGDWQVYPGKGYVVAFANPTGSSGYGQDFTDGIGCDWGGRVFEDLMFVTDALEDLPFVDKDRMGAMGWSYGGYMMMWFQGHTDRFAAHAAMMGLYDLDSFYGATEELFFPEKDLCGQPWNSESYQQWSPSHFVDQFSTPSLVISGELDYRVPYTQSLQYFTALQKKKVPSRLVIFPNAGHWPAWYEMAFYYNAHLDWFHHYLGGEKAPWDVYDHARGGGPHEEETEETEEK